MSKLPLGIVPRMLSRDQAAEYCGCESVGAFDDWRRRGIVPEPMPGTTKWDRKLIDRWLDRRSGLIADTGPSIDEWLAQQESDPLMTRHEDPFLGGNRTQDPARAQEQKLMLPTDPVRRVVRFPDVARELGVSPASLRQLCKKGEGPPLLQLSERCLGVRRGDLDAWIESRKVVS